VPTDLLLVVTAAAPMTASGEAMVAALHSWHVFAACVMGRRADMALPIPRFVHSHFMC
jgi:hypothetical protein